MKNLIMLDYILDVYRTIHTRTKFVSKVNNATLEPKIQIKFLPKIKVYF